jgi:hypothetical protein
MTLDELERLDNSGELRINEAFVLVPDFIAALRLLAAYRDEVGGAHREADALLAKWGVP